MLFVTVFIDLSCSHRIQLSSEIRSSCLHNLQIKLSTNKIVTIFNILVIHTCIVYINIYIYIQKYNVFSLHM